MWCRSLVPNKVLHIFHWVFLTLSTTHTLMKWSLTTDVHLLCLSIRRENNVIESGTTLSDFHVKRLEEKLLVGFQTLAIIVAYSRRRCFLPLSRSPLNINTYLSIFCCNWGWIYVYIYILIDWEKKFVRKGWVYVYIYILIDWEKNFERKRVFVYFQLFDFIIEIREYNSYERN